MQGNSSHAPGYPWKTMLSAQDRQPYEELFKAADTERKGILLKDEAMEFFKKSEVPVNILNQIWDAADTDKKGFLTDYEFCVALKMIACAQNGKVPESPVITTSVPLPYFKGIHVQPPLPPNRQDPVRSASPAPPSPSLSVGSLGGDTITPEERNKYISIFQSSGPVDGVLSGEKAKEIFLRSNLPSGILHNIWALADTRKSGTLNQTEFIIAMHYISRAMSNQPLPSSLPAAIYAAAASGRIMSPVISKMARSPTIQRQTTGSPTAFTGHQSHQANRGDLDISPEEYARYKAFFEQLDTNKTGYITGADAVHFFRHSKLPEQDLAQIWDLADTNQTGQLDERQFAVAMHLVNRRMAGGQIPPTLYGIPQVGLSRQPTNMLNSKLTTQSVDLLGLGDTGTDTVQQPTATYQQPTFTGNQQQPTAAYQQPTFTGNQLELLSLNAQRSELEANLSAIRAESRVQMDRSAQLRAQYEAEARAVKELQETVQREKEALEALKRAASEAERQLEEEKRKKEELSRELMMYKQEAKHYKQRAESAQQQLQQIRSDKPSEPSPSTSGDLFSLSNAPLNDLFGGTDVLHRRPESVASTDSSIGVSSPQEKSSDPFSGLKGDKRDSTMSSPAMSLNRPKEEAVSNKQARSTTPNVDINEIEAKFPDLSTMESNFQSPVSNEPKDNEIASPRPSSQASVHPFPSISNTSVTQTKSPIIQSTTSPSLSQKQALSPSQAKSVAKYGFDISAFEEPSDTPVTASGTGSVKDDLHSLFGSPSGPAQQNKPSSSTFDDIFSVSSKDVGENSKEQKKPTFDDMFFS